METTENNTEIYPPQETIKYRGYNIEPVFHYSTISGEYMHSDFNVFHENSETGYMEHCKTLSEVKDSIDEMVEENIND